jgi:hypothetical protein
VNTIGVESVDEFAAKVEASGGKVVLPKMAIPGVGWQAYCTDTEGNIFRHPSARPEGEVKRQDSGFGIQGSAVRFGTRV